MKTDYKFDSMMLSQACLLAFCDWVKGEGQLFQASENGIDHWSEETFNRFLIQWGVARNLSKDLRTYVLNTLKEQKMHDTKPTALPKVAQNLGLARTPYSLVSKVAFYANPTVFTPQDTLSTAGLNMICGLTRERKIKRSEYGEYQVHFVSLVRTLEVSFPKGMLQVGSFDDLVEHIPSSELFKEIYTRRVVDKYLMLAGKRS